MAFKLTIEELKEAKKQFEEKHPTPRLAKIQKVQEILKDHKKFAEHYKPKLVSFGPIHYKLKQLQQGEQYKKMWAAAQVESSQENDEKLYEKIKNNIVELKNLYTKDAIIGMCNEDLAWMLFVDGCAVLYFLKNAFMDDPEKLKIKIDQMLVVQQDLLLLENQLPYRLLELLTHDSSQLKHSMKDFCEIHDLVALLEDPRKSGGRGSVRQHTVSICKEKKEEENPTHLLDCLRKFILAKHAPENDCDACMVPNCVCKCKISLKTPCLISKTPKDPDETDSGSRENDPKRRWPKYRNIQDLKAAGIRVKTNKSNVSLQNIYFESSLFGGHLYLPPLIMDDSTDPMLHNLIAYEMCLDFKNDFEICSYVKFLDSLIDRPEDVKELRSASILQNALGSDQEVSDMFNNISHGLMLNPRIYKTVRTQMDDHCERRVKTWIAEVYYDHFRSPWTIIAFLAARSALLLTAIQTWQGFVHP